MIHHPHITTIRKLIARAVHAKPSSMMGAHRSQTMVWARSLLYHLSREYTNMSWPEIGNQLGKCHDTVLRGARRWQNLASSVPHLAELEKQVRTQFAEVRAKTDV